MVTFKMHMHCIYKYLNPICTLNCPYHAITPLLKLIFVIYGITTDLKSFII